MNRLPAWSLQSIPDSATRAFFSSLEPHGVRTVCQEARCPNITQCVSQKEITFLILGAVCTRRCSFCNVEKASGALQPVESREPQRLRDAVKSLGLTYVVITSVTRDDLSDGGARQFAVTLDLLHELSPEIKVEVLIPDFKEDLKSVATIVRAHPDVIAHNIETVRRLYPVVRPQAEYNRSLKVLSFVKEYDPCILTKSSLILGLGETEEEVVAAMGDLRLCGCDILTLGQYLAPSPLHYPVKKFVSLKEFACYRKKGLSLGFKAVLSEPLARSSYKAKELYRELSLCMTS